VVGSAHASVVMAAFCTHRAAAVQRRDDRRLYAARALATAHPRDHHHRTAELAEIGVSDGARRDEQYLAGFDAAFHDVRGDDAAFAPLHDPASYEASQHSASRCARPGRTGIVYRSVRHAAASASPASARPSSRMCGRRRISISVEGRARAGDAGIGA